MDGDMKVVLMVKSGSDSTLRGFVANDQALLDQVKQLVLSSMPKETLVIQYDSRATDAEEFKNLLTPKTEAPPTISPLRAHDVGEEPELSHA